MSEPTGTPEQPPQPQQQQSPTEPSLPAWATRKTSPDAMSDAHFAAYIGPKWETTYRRKLAPFREDPSFVPTWNWSAALFTGLWFLYRKLYLAFALLLLTTWIGLPLFLGPDTPVTPAALSDPENANVLYMMFGFQLAVRIAAGGTANWLLFRRARAAYNVVRLQGLSDADGIEQLRRFGGVNRTGAAFMFVLTFAMTLLQVMGIGPR